MLLAVECFPVFLISKLVLHCLLFPFVCFSVILIFDRGFVVFETCAGVCMKLDSCAGIIWLIFANCVLRSDVMSAFMWYVQQGYNIIGTLNAEKRYMARPATWYER